MTGPNDDDLLLSDDERLHALNALGDHYAAGRLDSTEFYDRSGVVASARTLGAIAEPFRGLPGGLPLQAVDGYVRKIPSDSPAVPEDATSAARREGSPEAELQSLRSRGNLVESLNYAVVGVTLVTFLVLQVVVGWDYAWIVWPTLIITLSIPRVLLKYSGEDEKVYEELKKSDAEARRARIAEAAKRIRELENRRD